MSLKGGKSENLKCCPGNDFLRGARGLTSIESWAPAMKVGKGGMSGKGKYPGLVSGAFGVGVEGVVSFISSLASGSSVATKRFGLKSKLSRALV